MCQVTSSNGTGDCKPRSKKARKEGRKDNEGVERWIPRNHIPRRGRCDLFSVTLRCLTGPMTSGVTNESRRWVDRSYERIILGIYTKGDWRRGDVEERKWKG